MAARTLDKMRKAQSLLRECHSWLVENDEILLAVNLCQIEGSLALFFENRCFANSPCPGLQGEELPRLPPSNGYRRRNHRRPYNGGRIPPPTGRGGPGAPARCAGGEQNARAQVAECTSKDIASKSACLDANLRPPQVRAAVTGPSPPTGVLLDFDNDVELVHLPPNMVADMEADAADIRPKNKQRLPTWPATVGSDEPAPEVLVRVEGDDRSLHQTVTTVADVATAGLDSPVGRYCSPPVAEEGSRTCDSIEGGSSCTQTYRQAHWFTESRKCKSTGLFPVLTNTGRFTKSMSLDLDDDMAITLPGGTNADTDSTTNREERDVYVSGLNPGAGHNPQPEDLEDDEIVFQGNAANSICPDFKTSFVRQRPANLLSCY
ncbi:hypothetical protein N7491_007101 [Penicillium cf. griseofulvum]|uniref:Uncharacterized protein n=1 Tax=Penicillium cf. griseofulvum TaxID=2972120 RepID=A0A9W9IUK4_9EURO|nr:hypothetical protein N7472_009870 [Penicillium cf. griseofulvum]KAJ5430085.1 hypothetical protein N7491_007101 [Penicillium cf. griseofulvum]